MQLGHTVSEPASSGAADETKVRETLHAILESAPFRTSRQCQNLLRYVVELSLKGDSDALRERVLGVEVFGRPAHYNTSEDPVVRMRAADVRKRLAQFYQSADPDILPIIIELPPGSYRAFFRNPPPAAEKLAMPAAKPEPPGVATALMRAEGLPAASSVSTREPAPGRGHWIRSRIFLLIVAVTLAAGALWYCFRPDRQLSAQQRFFVPLTASKKPVLIDLGSNVAYRFTSDYLANYEKAHGFKEYVPETFVDLPPHSAVRASDLVRVPNTFITVGDLAASTQLVSLLSGWHKPIVLRSANDITIGDLRNTPMVLIGGFNNPWALEATRNMRFSLAQGDRIVDRADPNRLWKTDLAAANAPTVEDYALITRTPHSFLGGP